MFTNCTKPVCPAVKHSMKFFVTGSSGVHNLPEFVGVVVVDEILVGYCDSSRTSLELKHDWVKELFKQEPRQLEQFNGQCFKTQPNYFRSTIHSLKQRFNQSEGTVFTSADGQTCWACQIKTHFLPDFQIIVKIIE